MKTPMYVLYVLLLLLVTFDAGPAMSEGKAAPAVAFAEVVRPPVYFKRNWQDPEKKLPKPMQAKQKILLHEGECVACGPGGQINLWLYPQPMIKLTGEKKFSKQPQQAKISWYVIPTIPPDHRDAVGEALANLIGAGRVRSTAVIFWPADKSTVWADALILRWKPLPNSQAITLTLTDLSGQTTLWKQDEVDGHSGNMISTAARDALHRWRDAGNTGNVLLQINHGSDPPSSIVFSVMSAEREAALKHDLAFWDTEPAGVFRCLGRAAVFDDYRLDAEEADEFEIALRLAPNSAMLRARTANALRNYGNTVRASELTSLQATSLPSHLSVKPPSH